MDRVDANDGVMGAVAAAGAWCLVAATPVVLGAFKWVGVLAARVRPRAAVILDFDGVLADSMPQHWEAYRRVLAPIGVEVDRLGVFRREGARSESIIRSYLEGRPEAADSERVRALADEKQRVFASLGDVQMFRGAVGFVQEVRAIAPRLGLVTGTRRVNLERWAPTLLPLFDAVLAEDAYARDKPHPEPYRKAIDALGAPAESCVVVENAPRGVESAKAAGAGVVVAITTTLPAEELQDAGADVVVADHEEALAAVRRALPSGLR